MRLGTTNRFECLESNFVGNGVEEDWVPKDTSYFIKIKIMKEKARKEKEWEATKSRLEEKMKIDIEKRRAQTG